jgi:hypothetical protein
MSETFERLNLTIVKGRVDGQVEVGFNDRMGHEVNVISGQNGTWHLSIIVGNTGVQTGGGVAFSGPKQGFEFGFRPQAKFPQRQDYVTMTLDAKGHARGALHVNSADPKHTRPIAQVIIEEGQLQAGDRVTVHIGDQSGGGPGSYGYSVVDKGVPIKGYIDPNGDGRYHEVNNSPAYINSVADAVPQRLHVNADSPIAVGESARIRITALDRMGNAVEGYQGTAHIEGHPGPPTQTAFQIAEGSAARATTTFPSPGVYRLQVTESEAQATGISNPIEVREDTLRYKVFWGDLHAHAYDIVEISELTPSTDYDVNFRYGRDVGHLDFCALTPHVMARDGDRYLRQWWDTLQASVERNNQPGDYITFAAYEWRGQGGDRNLILPPPADVYNPPQEALDELYDLAAAYQGLVIPHVGGATARWDYHDPRVEFVLEIASMHGNFEWFAQEALQRGYKLGIIASSDGHANSPGHPRRLQTGYGRRGDLNRRDCGYGGCSYAGVWAAELTRASLLRAIKARHTYAVTAERMLISFWGDGHMMGDVYQTDHYPTFSASVVASHPIRRLEVIRNQSVIQDLKNGGLEEHFTFTDRGIRKGENYYYLRVTLDNGELGWSSPIWVNASVAGEMPKTPPRAWNAEDFDSLDEVPVSPRAKRHLPALEAYLKREEDPERFVPLIPYRVIEDSPLGPYLLVLSYDTVIQRPVHIKYFFGYEADRIRVNAGWRDFGQYPDKPRST